MSKKDWIDYVNLAANIHQSIKLGEISNQLGELKSINEAMLGNMDNLVNIEVYKLEKEDNEKQFKQLLFNLKKFLKTKYEDPLTVALLNVGHASLLNVLLNSFQKQLTSFDDKEYIEELIDGINEYSKNEIDFTSLGEKDEDGVALLLSYLMINDNMCAIDKKLKSSNQNIDKIKGEYITPMKRWTFDSFNKHLEMIDSPSKNLVLKVIRPENDPRKIRKMTNEDRLFNIYKAKVWHEIDSGWDEFQVIFDKNKNIKNIATSSQLSDVDNLKNKGFFSRKMFYQDIIDFAQEKDKIENEILPALIKDSENASDNLSVEMKSSLRSLSNDISKSNSKWIDVEKKLLNIMYDTPLPIQGPYQYRKQVIGL